VLLGRGVLSCAIRGSMWRKWTVDPLAATRGYASLVYRQRLMGTEVVINQDREEATVAVAVVAGKEEEEACWEEVAGTIRSLCWGLRRCFCRCHQHHRRTSRHQNLYRLTQELELRRRRHVYRPRS
jgi:hypothetical protein